MSTATPPVLVLSAPLSGTLVPIDRVPDPVFAQRLAGDGVAIDPTSSVVLAPCAGRVAHVHACRHALTLRTGEGLEVMLHVGLDTVTLRGEGFRLLVSEHDAVRTGDPLVEFDADLLRARGRTLLTQIVVTTPHLVSRLVAHSGTVVAGQDAVAEVTLPCPTEGGREGTGERVSGPLVLRMPAGLHARPAARLASAAAAFSSAVRLRHGAAAANARSVLALLELDAGHLDTVEVSAEGADAADAVRGLAALIESGFGETGGPPSPREAGTGRRQRVPGATPPSLVRGTGASPGVAVGPLCRLRPAVEAPRERADGPRAERRALETAIAAAAGELERLEARHGGEANGIFAAQAGMLADPDLWDTAVSAIEFGRSAATAWQRAVEVHAARIGASRHPAIAATASDLRDAGGRVLRLLDGGAAHAAPPEGCIVVVEDVTPSAIASFDRARVAGVCSAGGSHTSHAAILARALSLPVVVACGDQLLEFPEGARALLDGSEGTLRLDPPEDVVSRVADRQARDTARRARSKATAHEPAVTRDGVRVEVSGNVGLVAEGTAVVEEGGEGVGLLRTEFLFLDRARPPSEDEQAAAFAEVAATLGPQRPLVIRALDVGGDKPVPGLPLQPAANPALGERGLRALLKHPEVLRQQLRAMLRAGAAGTVRITFPMVSGLDEWRAAKALLDEEARQLGVPPLPAGIMVEVPSAALLADAFAPEVALLSIGTNDLAQYTLAVDRAHPPLAARADALHPAVLRLIAHTVDAAGAHATPVAVCGDLAADPQAIPILVGLGLRSLSVSVPAIAAVKAAVRNLHTGTCRDLAVRALRAETAADVRALVPLPDA